MCLPGGVCQGGGCLPAGCLPAGCLPARGVHLLPRTEFLTHACENITSFADEASKKY